MIGTTIKHGDLVFEFDSAEWVRITRQSNMETVQLSASEFALFQRCVEIRGWPVYPPQTRDPSGD